METAWRVLSSSRARWALLAGVIVATTLLRLVLIAHFPDPDGDARGHLGIARALLSHPENVSSHWVYLPAYHYLLALLLGAGMSANAIRALNSLLAATIPLFVLGYARSTAGARASGRLEHLPWIAALFCAVSPLVNLLGTSAQQETLFSLLVLCTVWAIDVRRNALAGTLLAIAALVRYEAWGGVALLAGVQALGAVPPVMRRLPRPLRAVSRLPFTVTAPALIAIFGWLLAHRLWDGAWFGFLRELYRYTHAQRAGLGHDGTVVWFLVEQPLYVFGWLVLGLFFLGLRRAWRPSHAVPLGIYFFLVGAFTFKGALGSARYYESLVPFVAVAAAHGVYSIAARRQRLAFAVVAASCVNLVVLSTELYRWSWPDIATRDTGSKSQVALFGDGLGAKSHAMRLSQ